jgi:peptidoglycan/LPS O-acetylase OafA/YrhL
VEGVPGVVRFGPDQSTGGGAGGLLAWAHAAGVSERRERLIRHALAMRFSQLPGLSSGQVILVPFCFVGSLVWVRVIHACANGSRSWAGRLLEWRPLVYVGKISYGIYV